MHPEFLPRPAWHGTPHELGALFVLQKQRRQARAIVLTHELGWELRLMIGAQEEIVETYVCTTREEMRATGERWG